MAANPPRVGGEAAREQLRQVATAGLAVCLVQDGRAEAENRYGRRLAHVEASGVELGQAVITVGYAQAWAPTSATRPARSTEYGAVQRDS